MALGELKGFRFSEVEILFSVAFEADFMDRIYVLVHFVHCISIYSEKIKIF